MKPRTFARVLAAGAIPRPVMLAQARRWRLSEIVALVEGKA
jgi:predicted DNA-binding transcriptional regulator AlpA